ncbi:MAG: Phosphotransferase enzyme family [Planctomycetota bacterium]
MNGLAAREHDPMLVRLLPRETLRVPCTDELAELLGATLVGPGGPRPVSSRLLWARWKPRTALSSAHAVLCEDGATRLVSVRRHQGGKDVGRVDPRARELAAPWACASVAPDGAFVSCWPHDPELPGLPRALDLARLSRALEDTELGDGGRIRRRRSSIELLRYKPSRRAVLALELVLRDEHDGLHRRKAIVRVLTPGAADSSASERDALPAGFAPRLLWREARTGILVEEHVVARPGLEAWGPAELDALAMRRSAELREACGLSGEEWIEDETATLAALFEVDPRLHALAARLCERHARRKARLRRVHGDYHPGQLARAADGRLVVYDWDECRVDEDGADASCWAAERLRGARPERAEELLARLLDADPELDEGALRARLAMDLVRKAAGAIRRLEAGALELAASALHLAEELEPRRVRGPSSTDPLPSAWAQAGVDERDIERVEPRKDGVLLCSTTDRQAVLVHKRRVARFGLEEDVDLPAAAHFADLAKRGEARIVSWRPSRRLVAQALADGLPAFWKCLPAGASTMLHARHELLRPSLTRCGWRVPRLLHVDRRRDALAFEALDGSPWDPEDAGHARRIAQLLRRWREAPLVPVAEPHGAAAELATCERFATRLAAAGLEVDWTARRLLARLKHDVALDSSPRCNAHRDFYEKQVLCGPLDACLLDLDLAGPSAPEQDPSNAILHLRMAAFLGACDPRAQQSAEEAFLRELQVERDSQAFGLWMALNALRMALVHAPRPRTRHASPWLLRVAAEAAERLAA